VSEGSCKALYSSLGGMAVTLWELHLLWTCSSRRSSSSGVWVQRVALRAGETLQRSRMPFRGSIILDQMGEGAAAGG
jgi:hypothetical protein